MIGSRAELEERATGGLEQLQELHRPWIDEVPIRCESCNEEVRRVTEVGDAWLDAGIVPFSTLGWENPEWVEHGNATGAAAGLTGADLPDHAYWEKWFPADWVSEMREQIRLWFYSISFMAVTLTGRFPYRSVLTYEKLLDEHGREMHRSWGNAIPADEAFERMGADVMRWQFCEQNPFLVILASILAVNALHTLMRHGAAMRVTSLLYLTPIVAVILEWMLYGVVPRMLSLMGIAVTCAGVALVTRARRTVVAEVET